ncbi:MAG: TonB-dependent receptor [Gammaproteobacteria bacterium]
MSLRPTRARFAAVLAWLLVITLCPARGWSADSAKKFHFEISRGVAAEQLQAFRSTTSLQLLFDFEAFKAVTASGVRGDLTAREALAQMFAGAPVQFEFVNPGTVGLRVEQRSASEAAPAKAIQKAARSAEVRSIDRRSADAGLEEVTVEGRVATSIRETGAPLITLSRTDIEAAGVVTAQGAVRTLPQIFGGGPTEDTAQGYEASTNVARGSGVNLRGLGANATLVLMNGRRLPGSGNEGLFVDVSNLPLAAVERIDILPDSSSTFYGSDAVAGVVNFVMRDHFEGQQSEAYFADSTRGYPLAENYVSQLIGAHTESGHGILAVDFYSRGNLPAAEREQARSDLRAFGGSNFDSPQSNPGNIVFGLGNWAVPKGQDGTHLQPSDFVRGVQNLQNRYEGADILPRQQRFSAFGSWRQELTDRADLFSDVLWGQRDVRSNGTGAVGNLVLPTTNAFYASPLSAVVPFQMGYSFYDDLGPQIVDARVRDFDATSGIDIHFENHWNAIATGSYVSESIGLDVLNQVNPSALASALASSNPNIAFNALGDGSHTNPATLDVLRGSTLTTSRSSIVSGALLVTGPLAALPAGDLRLSFGGDARSQRFRGTLWTDTVLVPAASSTDRRRFIHSGFAELQVPMVGPANRVPGIEALAVSLAERYEHYSDFGQALTPRLGLSWSPVGGVTVRGTYSMSFRPPGLLDLDESNNVYGLTPLRDPLTGALVQTLLWAGKNRDLREETARSWTAGLEFEPERYPGAALAVTYFNTTFTNRLSTPAFATDLLSNPFLSPLVVRNPSAEYRAQVCSRAPIAGSQGSCLATPIMAIADLRLRNDARAFTSGMDLIGRYQVESRFGSFTFGLNGTYILDFSEAKAANLPLVNRVSTQNYPVDLKMRASARWRYRALDFTAYSNFLNRYEDVGSSPARRVSSLTTFDLHAAYTLRATNTTIALGVDNVFDEDPPFLNNAGASIGYDQENGDLIGRMVSATVRKVW